MLLFPEACVLAPHASWERPRCACSSPCLLAQVEVIAEGDYSNELYIIVHGELQARLLPWPPRCLQRACQQRMGALAQHMHSCPGTPESWSRLVARNSSHVAAPRFRWADRHVGRGAGCRALSMHVVWQELGAGAAGRNADVRLQVDQHTSVHGGQCASPQCLCVHRLRMCFAQGM